MVRGKETLALYSIATSTYITENVQMIRLWIAALAVVLILAFHWKTSLAEYRRKKEAFEHKRMALQEALARKNAAYRQELEHKQILAIKQHPEPDPEIEMLPTSIDLSFLDAKPTKIYHYVPPTPRKKDNFSFRFDPEDYEGDHQAKRVKHEHKEDFWAEEEDQKRKRQYGDLKPEFIKYLRQLAEFQKRIDFIKRQAQLTVPPPVKAKKPRKSCGI